MTTQGQVLIKKNWTTPGRRTITAPAGSPERPLEIVVLDTTTKGTLAALRSAGALAKGLGARIRLLVTEVVPYPLPLTAPPVSVAFTQRYFRTLAGTCAIDTAVDVRLCRDQQQLLKDAIAPKSIVVLGGERHWWPTREARAAKCLERLGHQVVFSETN